MITATQARELLDYNPSTGIFKWKVNVSRGMRAGKIAGCTNNYGYRVIRIAHKGYKAHRLAWLIIYGNLPPDQIDHISGVKNDNRLINLRLASSVINGQNQKKPRNNKSSVIGVCWTKNKWETSIKVNNESIYLGRYDNIFDAVCARKTAEIKNGFHPNHGKR